MNHAELRQWFYSQLTAFYAQGELQSIYHWCIAELEGWNRAEAYMHNADLVAESELNRWKETTERLKKHEPIQYIFGKAQFMELELYVNATVLIPRPETEELVQLVFDHESSDVLKVLDIGTGSGCIPLALKAGRPDWRISACDISLEALEIASKNAKALNLDIDLFHADIREEPEQVDFDVIVSNPPYIPVDLAESLEANVLDYEPHIALFSPAHDPFYFFKRIAEIAEKAGVSKVYFETHATDIEALLSILSGVWQGEIAAKKDLSGKDRFVVLSRS